MFVLLVLLPRLYTLLLTHTPHKHSHHHHYYCYYYYYYYCNRGWGRVFRSRR